MKLYWSSRSPYVRKVMIVAHEVGLADRITCEAVRITTTEAHRGVMKHNPLGKIPTLVLDDGTVIHDSGVICAYFDTQHRGRPLLPEDPRERLVADTWQALGDGLMQTLLSWLSEGSRAQPGESDRRIAVCRIKVDNVLAVLERDATRLLDTPFTIGHAAIGSALAYMNFRFEEDWRTDHPGVAEWHTAFSERPSVVATAFRDETAVEPGGQAREEPRNR